MDDIIAAIEAALERKGLSASAASLQAVGNPSLIKNLKNRRTDRERAHPIDNLRALADVLGLEFYFGAPRAVEATTQINGERFATVPRYAATAAAGDGLVNPEDQPVDHLAFSLDWLMQNGIRPEECMLITARGDSMAPAISDGDLVMLDRRKTAITSGKIYVYNDPEDGTRVKRLEVVPDTALIVRSDNPDQERFPPEFHTGPSMNTISQNILGQVIWSGRTWR